MMFMISGRRNKGPIVAYSIFRSEKCAKQYLSGTVLSAAVASLDLLHEVWPAQLSTALNITLKYADSIR